MPPSIIERAAVHCVSSKFERIFDKFARDNADVFMDAVEAKGDDIEHKHEYKLLHDKYLKLFEEELSDFLESEGSTPKEFFRECRDIVDGNAFVLFEEHQEHADVFIDATECKDGDVEHKHEYKQLHDRYLELFEEALSDFVESEGSTVEEFFRECRDILDGNYTALFEEHKYGWFVDRLLACLEYKQFYGLMVNEARRINRSRK
ncbi:TPA: hypothetical protein N0F65_008195 [Lagenidium giganteum]|uniref:Cilia- and flagella-associated protein 36 n=1 Tax=Lagenidium giganteum TaxID=4803 RepID=A0AAV2YK12_9STRA|nr:TPA: hypothetical protein N0F65_008195 [Lagenidium giganteum]